MNTNPFCRDCFMHIRQANRLLHKCAENHSDPQQYQQIGYEFTVLASEARSSRMEVLASYATALATFARDLVKRSEKKVADEEFALLEHGIALGLPCHEGEQLEQCPNRNFDRVWPLITELRSHTS
jgi:hypothetical protein